MVMKVKNLDDDYENDVNFVNNNDDVDDDESL